MSYDRAAENWRHRACLRCGTSLDGHRRHAIFCGAPCRAAAWRSKNAAATVDGVFRDWNIDYYAATHTDGYVIWICTGFANFKDYQGSYVRKGVPFLAGQGTWRRWRLWRELKREKRRRAEVRVEALRR